MIALEVFTAALLVSVGGWWLRGAGRTQRDVGRFSAHSFFPVPLSLRAAPKSH